MRGVDSAAELGIAPRGPITRRLSRAQAWQGDWFVGLKGRNDDAPGVPQLSVSSSRMSLRAAVPYMM